MNTPEPQVSGTVILYLLSFTPKPPCPSQTSLRLNQNRSLVPTLLKSLGFVQEARYTAEVGVGFLKENQRSRRTGLNSFHGLMSTQPFSFSSFRGFFNGAEVSLLFPKKMKCHTVQLYPMFSPWISGYSKTFFLCEHHGHSGTMRA